MSSLVKKTQVNALRDTGPIRPISELSIPRRKGSPPPHSAQQDPALYRVLLQGLYDAVIISDLTGAITEANHRAEKFLMYSIKEFTGQRIGNIIAGVDDGVLDRIRRHVAEGRFTVLDAHCIRKNRSTFPAEVAISFAPITQEGNLVFSIRNIEWRKTAELKLRTEHNAIQNSAGSIVITDMAGRLNYANPAFLRMTGHENEKSLLRRNIVDFWEEKDVARQLIDTPRDQESWIGELTMRNRKGKLITVKATAALNRDAQGQRIGMVFSFIDITEQKKAMEAIRREAEAQMQSAREKEDFSGMLNIISIPDILQLAEATRKNGILTIPAYKEYPETVIHFVEGRIVHAIRGKRVGIQAVYDLIRVGGESFYFKQGQPDFPEETITESTMSILIEANQRMDENNMEIE